MGMQRRQGQSKDIELNLGNARISISLGEGPKKLETNYQQKLDDLEELKKTILQKAFEGQL